MSTERKRTVVYLPPALEQWLDKEAARTYSSVGAVIRLAIQKLMEEKSHGIS